MAALVLHLSLPLTRHQSSVIPSSLPSYDASDSASATCRNFSKPHKFHSRGRPNFRKGLVCMSSFTEIPFLESKDEVISSLKLKLLKTVSGLNRGLAASECDLRDAEAAAKELESAGGAVDLSTDLDKLQGRWKLVYSSAFSSRTLGGSRPGPPTGRLLPITLGQVFQRIDILSKDFDNIVELELGAPWPLPPIELTASLGHKFELVG